MPPRRAATPDRIEWPTVCLVAACYAGWMVAVFGLALLSIGLAVVTLAVLLTLHSSLCHEALHGHPFPNRRVNEALVIAPLGLFVPYPRFRDLHLEHHRDSDLTDPYDDPESNYLDPAVWGVFPAWQRALFRVNNMLLGRMLLGPALGTARFVLSEVRL
ncbi:unnamed protein product, partial [Ectocarpus sp. 12 AP-2014]